MLPTTLSNFKQTKFSNSNFPTLFRIFEVKRKLSNFKLFSATTAGE